MADKIYVIKDNEKDDIVGITADKESLKSFLKHRDPSRYEWVKIKNKKHIELTKNRYLESTLTSYGDFALSQIEFEIVQDRMMEIPPCILYDCETLIKNIKYLKLTEEEKDVVSEAIAIVYSLFKAIEEPPEYLDGVIDESFLFDEYLLAKKVFFEECL